MAANPLDPVLDFDRVLLLAHRHLPAAERVTGVDESGGEARAYAIDEGYIFKTQRPHRVRPRTSLEKEVVHLRLLATHIPELPVPRVLGYARDGEIEFTLMTRIPGSAVLNAALTGEARAEVLRTLGQHLRRLHRLQVALLRESGLFPGDEDAGDIRRRLESDMQRAVETLADSPDWSLPLGPAAVAARALDPLGAIGAQLVGLHSNPGPEHVFIDPCGGRLSGIIDFGDAYISHPAFDLRRWPDEKDRKELLAGYAADEPLGDGFHTCWRAVAVAGLLNDVAFRPSRRLQSLEALRTIAAGR